MKILVTGNQGYIGSVLTELLIQKGQEVVGYDTGYYAGCELYPHQLKFGKQITKDIRAVSPPDLEGVEAVIHLAALSNDPLGELDPFLTEEINLRGTLRLAELAKRQAVRRFIYSSSQSMYGIAETGKELEEDESEKNPLTVYARTKWQAEVELQKLNSPDFTVVCLRPSTVFGASPMLRSDIVFNNLVAGAYTTGRIEIKSDGTPWRPVIHVRDLSSAFLAALEAPPAIVAGQSFNVGSGNFRVSELAQIAQRAVPGSEIFYTGESGGDERTYQVSFKKIGERLKDYYHPRWTLEAGAQELIDLFKKIDFREEQFRGRNCVRLKQIRYLKENGRLDNRLFWVL